MSADFLQDGSLSEARRQRRILSLWFPRLAAERVLRQERILIDQPLAVVREEGNMRLILAVTEAAETRGAYRGQALQEALSVVPGLVTRTAQPDREREFLIALRRWAGKFSPWVAEEGAASLLIDLTGCAHLFGGETALLDHVATDCAVLGLTVRAAIADTAGAAWALARYAPGAGSAGRSGDAIDQEARATRSRAVRRKNWEKGGPAPQAVPMTAAAPAGLIAPPGQMRRSLADLPVAALRISPETATGLGRLGLRRIGDLTGMARAALARRFGRDLVQRLDQALGLEPEPISPAEAPLHFAARLSFPEPIGLESDILAALDRLLPVLCDGLRKRTRGARRLRLELSRVDGAGQVIEVALARPSDQPDRIRPLFELKISAVDPGFGIDRVRLIAHETEPLHRRQMTGGWAAAEAAEARQSAGAAPLDDLIGRLGARIGLEAITRLHPSESHIPEKTEKTLAAAWSEPAEAWPKSNRPRPLVLCRPEPVHLPQGDVATPDPPETFRWRGQELKVQSASGPERIAPEWWLDDPDWRSGVRDYWRVETDQGARLWLFYAHGAGLSSGWFAHGDFN